MDNETQEHDCQGHRQTLGLGELMHLCPFNLKESTTLEPAVIAQQKEERLLLSVYRALIEVSDVLYTITVVHLVHRRLK